MTERQRIPTEQQKILSEMWMAGAAAAEIAAALGITKAAVYTLRWQYGLPKRPRVNPEEINPTPEEIERLKLELRERHYAERRAETDECARIKAWRHG